MIALIVYLITLARQSGESNSYIARDELAWCTLYYYNIWIRKFGRLDADPRIPSWIRYCSGLSGTSYSLTNWHWFYYGYDDIAMVFMYMYMYVCLFIYYDKLYNPKMYVLGWSLQIIFMIKINLIKQFASENKKCANQSNYQIK